MLRSGPVAPGRYRIGFDTQAYFDMPGSYGDDETGYFDDYPDEDPYQSANIWLDAPQDIGGSSYTVPKWTIVVLEEQ